MNDTMTTEIEGKVVVVYYPQESIPMKWDDLINSIATEYKGECLGTGTMLETMERDMQFKFPTIKQAKHFKKRIELFAKTTYTKKREY